MWYYFWFPLLVWGESSSNLYLAFSILAVHTSFIMKLMWGFWQLWNLSVHIAHRRTGEKPEYVCDLPGTLWSGSRPNLHLSSNYQSLLPLLVGQSSVLGPKELTSVQRQCCAVSVNFCLPFPKTNLLWQMGLGLLEKDGGSVRLCNCSSISRSFLKWSLPLSVMEICVWNWLASGNWCDEGPWLSQF